jgi:hypothetical protein
MPVVLVVQGQGITRESYEASVKELTDGGSLQSPADWPVPGLLAHVAGEGPNGFRVVDVWETEEAMHKFGDRLMPVLAGLGVEAEPEIYQTHTFVSA